MTEASSIEYHERSQIIWPIFIYLYTSYTSPFSYFSQNFSFYAKKAMCYLHLDPISLVYPHLFTNVLLKYGKSKYFGLLYNCSLHLLSPYK